MQNSGASAGVIEFPKVNLMEVMSAPTDEAKRDVVLPLINTFAVMSARLITLADDHEEILRVSQPDAADTLREEIEDFAVQYTEYFAENVTCLGMAAEFGVREAHAVCGQMLHGATVAAKRVPSLLWRPSISNVVAKGFDDSASLSADARRDQDAMIDSLMAMLTVTAPTETPEHLGTLAHAMVNWGRRHNMYESIKGDPRPSPVARSEAVARIILNRLGRDADAELNPDGQVAA